MEGREKERGEARREGWEGGKRGPPGGRAKCFVPSRLLYGVMVRLCESGGGASSAGFTPGEAWCRSCLGGETWAWSSGREGWELGCGGWEKGAYAIRDLGGARAIYGFERRS